MKSKSGPKPKREIPLVIEIKDGTIEPPAWLDKEAKEVWKIYAPSLISAGTLTPMDVGIFAGFCSQVSLIKKCHESMAKRGLFNTNGYGTQSVAPEVRIMNSASELMLRFAKELGMTPKSRGSKVQFRVPTQAPSTSPEKTAQDRRARLFKVVE